MQIRCKPATDPSALSTECLVLPVRGEAANKTAKVIDKAAGGSIKRLIKSGDFKTGAANTLLIPTGTGVSAKRILLVATGDKRKLEPATYTSVVEQALSALARSGATEASIAIDDIEVEGRDRHWQLQTLAQIAVTQQYSYGRTLSKKSAQPSLRKLNVVTGNTAVNRKAIATGEAIAQGINLARELGNLPANICTPGFLAGEARRLGRNRDKVKVTVLDEKKMRELKMGSLLSVTAGTREPAKLIIVEYRGGRKDEAPQVLVGKGITFDSGGISLKPGAKMDEMKFDMCGAAGVLGATRSVIELGLKLNLVTIVAAAENLPSGTATKPGDVVTSMSGQTIEVLNTDAEGRLVLCDALTYAARFKPDTVIDVATLTGACVVALGKHASGLFSNHDALAADLLDAGERSGDRAWRLPLWDDYQQQLKSNFADIANVGGPEAGSITAACFLARFTKAYRWAHLDIAGSAWLGGAQKGATGRPVALLTQFLIDKAA